MRLHRFFARNLSRSTDNGGTSERKEIAEGSIITYQQDTHQWQRVFRYGQGDRVILFDGSGKDYVCEIQQYQGETAVLRVVEVRDNFVKPVRQVILVAAIVKRDTFEWIVEKATELGVTEIIPVLAERSEKKNLNTERLEKIMIEAAEQSGRGDVPVLHGVSELSKVLSNKDIYSSSVVFDPSGEKFSEKNFSSSEFTKISLFIGPEGGWSAEELESFKRVGASIVSFGPQILRTETAAIAALSKFVF